MVSDLLSLTDSSLSLLLEKVFLKYPLTIDIVEYLKNSSSIKYSHTITPDIM
jgi:hypothetical protein